MTEGRRKQREAEHMQADGRHEMDEVVEEDGEVSQRGPGRDSGEDDEHSPPCVVLPQEKCDILS
jgi:hypothetical protein